MLEMLKTPFGLAPTIDPVVVAGRLLAALLFGALVAFVYRRTRDELDVTPSFPPTLVLLAVLIAMSTQVIGDNVARAFSLVGALSIVRFRTVVRDTQDTAFVIFAVVVGMAAGANNLWVAAIGLVIVGSGAWLFRVRTSPAVAGTNTFILNVRVALGVDLHQVLDAADTFVERRTMQMMGTARQGLAIDATYLVQLRIDRAADELITAMNQIDGVQHVELRRPEQIND